MNKHQLTKTHLYLAVAVLLTITTLGCSLLKAASSQVASAQQAAAAAAEPLAACSLLTEAEWETLVGPPSLEPEERNDEATYVTPPEYSSMCTYVGPKGSVVLLVKRPHGTSATSAGELAAELRQREASALAEMGNAQVQPLEGLGVPAAWYDVRDYAKQVWVVAIQPSGEGTYLRVQALELAQTPDVLEQAKGIAEKALSRLP